MSGFAINISIEDGLYGNSDSSNCYRAASDAEVSTWRMQFQSAKKDEELSEVLLCARILADSKERLEEILEVSLTGRQNRILFDAIEEYYFASKRQKEK